MKFLLDTHAILWYAQGNAGFRPSTINPHHIERTKSPDFIHRDPFGRLLTALAQTEEFTIITHDSTIPKYDVRTAW